MPIVVDEVVISVEVGGQGGGGAAAGSAPPEDKQAMIQECVERVLEILERKTER